MSGKLRRSILLLFVFFVRYAYYFDVGSFEDFMAEGVFIGTF